MDNDYPAQYNSVEPTYGGVGLDVLSIKHRVSYRKQLEMQAQELENRAADIRQVLESFDKNPELENLLNAMRRLGV